ncbi:MAG: hypothetical protein P9L99_19405 [Candidatus Lernaella stagnicola]|nr:hypothetical protein [Candidatus Lernaella stagnicola]
MARVCPQCRRMVGDDEDNCRQCGAPTVTPDQWRAMRYAAPSRPPGPPAPQPKKPPEQTPEQVEQWAKIGMGGIFAFFLFFVVFLVAYAIKAF